jgi:hypothetical protein
MTRQGVWETAIINGLSAADTTVKSLLNARVPFFASENTLYSSNWQMHYLYTMRDSIEFLLGSVRQQIDTSFRFHTGKSSGFSNSRGDTSKQSQSNQVVKRFDVAIGTSKYKDATDATSSSSSNRSRTSSAFRTDSFTYADKGSGGGTRKGLTTGRAKAHRNSWNRFKKDTTTRGVVNISYEEHGWNQVDASGFGAGLVANTTNTYTGEKATDGSSGRRHTVTIGVGTGEGKVIGTSKSNRDGKDTSTSFFRSNVTSGSTGSGGSSMNDDGSSSGHAQSLGTGAGDSADQSRGEQLSKYQAKMDSHGDTESHRGSSSDGFTEVHADKYHQRFLHLQDMLDEVNLQIVALKERASKTNVAYSTGNLIATLPAWCTDASNPRWRGEPCA